MIIGIVGLPGSAKTYFAVKLALERLKRKEKVYSNIEIIYKEKTDKEQKAILFDKLEIILSQVANKAFSDRQKWIDSGKDKHDFWPERTTIVVDEIGILYDARDWETFSNQLVYYFKQTRKIGIDIIWTTQCFADLEKKVRGITDFVWDMRKLPFGLRMGFKFDTIGIDKIGAFNKPKVYDRVIFKLNKGIWYSYDTLTCIIPTVKEITSKYSRYRYNNKFAKNLNKNLVIDDDGFVINKQDKLL